MKNPEIFIITGAIVAVVAGGSYFLMGSNKDYTSNLDTGYSRGNRIVASNVNPVPSELKENYFGGKHSKKRKYNKKKGKSVKR